MQEWAILTLRNVITVWDINDNCLKVEKNTFYSNKSGFRVILLLYMKTLGQTGSSLLLTKMILARGKFESGSQCFIKGNIRKNFDVLDKGGQFLHMVSTRFSSAVRK